MPKIVAELNHVHHVARGVERPLERVEMQLGQAPQEIVHQVRIGNAAHEDFIPTEDPLRILQNRAAVLKQHRSLMPRFTDSLRFSLRDT